MKSKFDHIKLDVFGESHSSKIGVEIENFPNGFQFSENKLQGFLDRRKSGNNPWSTPRKEDDKVVFESGVENGKIVSDKIVAIIENKNIKPKDYSNVLKLPRPSHADFVSYKKDGKIVSGGGRFSGRMTAPICIAGGIAIQYLENLGITTNAYVSQIGTKKAISYKSFDIKKDLIHSAKSQNFFTLSENGDFELTQEVISASKNEDSIGGVVECLVFGINHFLGDAMFDGLESKISQSVFAIPAVKGVEFGSGFDLAEMLGSEGNDCFVVEDNKVLTKTNHSGGINGGISNGNPIALRVGFRPTPSIGKIQKSVNLDTMKEEKMQIKGRHDACIVPRAVPVVEAMVALSLLDEILKVNYEN